METKQIGKYLIIAGAVILVLKFIKAIISFILSDFLLGLGTILLIAGAVLLSMKFIKENKDVMYRVFLNKCDSVKNYIILVILKNGELDRIRTCDLRIRSALRVVYK